MIAKQLSARDTFLFIHSQRCDTDKVAGKSWKIKSPPKPTPALSQADGGITCCGHVSAAGRAKRRAAGGRRRGAARASPSQQLLQLLSFGETEERPKGPCPAREILHPLSLFPPPPFPSPRAESKVISPSARREPLRNSSQHPATRMQLSRSFCRRTKPPLRHRPRPLTIFLIFLCFFFFLVPVP